MGNLAELATVDPEPLMANPSPALRAALERHMTQTGEGVGVSTRLSIPVSSPQK
jgi:hypothetical protein